MIYQIISEDIMHARNIDLAKKIRKSTCSKSKFFVRCLKTILREAVRKSRRLRRSGRRPRLHWMKGSKEP